MNGTISPETAAQYRRELAAFELGYVEALQDVLNDSNATVADLRAAADSVASHVSQSAARQAAQNLLAVLVSASMILAPTLAQMRADAEAPAPPVAP